VISNEIPKVGETVNLVTFVSGGKAPYTYDIQFTPNIIADIKQKQSLDGQIIASIAAVAVTADTRVSFSIRVKDSEGKEASFDSKDAGKKLQFKK
jgi:hypothetical protein